MAKGQRRTTGAKKGAATVAKPAEVQKDAAAPEVVAQADDANKGSSLPPSSYALFAAQRATRGLITCALLAALLFCSSFVVDVPLLRQDVDTPFAEPSPS